MESALHLDLKRRAAGWAREQGYACLGFEVAVPNSPFRADLAGYRPESRLREPDGMGGRKRRVREAAVGTTVILECKQARCDLLRDTAVADLAGRKLRELHSRREVLERLLRVHCPSLASGETLFPDFEVLSPEALAHAGYQRVLREIGRLQRAVMQRTKFERMVRYRCANLHYLVVPDGLLDESEIPLQWGLLVMRGPSLEMVRRPAWVACSEGMRLGLLHRLAAAATRRAVDAVTNPAGMEAGLGRGAQASAPA